MPDDAPEQAPTTEPDNVIAREMLACLLDMANATPRTCVHNFGFLGVLTTGP